MLRNYNLQRAIVSTSVLALTLALYLSTLAPGLTWRNNSADGAELITAASTFGVAHPPGYPTYLIISAGFTKLIPAHDLAYEFNLFSAISAASSVFLFFFLLTQVLGKLSKENHGGSRHLAIAGACAMTLATSSVLWSQATVTEVYALNALFLTIILILWLEMAGEPEQAQPNIASGAPGMATPSTKDRQRKWWRVILGPALGALCLGVGIGNHFTLIFLLPVLILLYVIHRTHSWLSSVIIVSSMLLGLGVHAYLPMAAASDPPINWGQANTLDGFRWLITAEPYRSLVFGIRLDEIPQRILSWAQLFIEQFTILGVVVGLLGFRYLWSRWPLLLASTFALWGLYTAYSLGYDTLDSYVYLIPSFVIFSIWIATGWLATVNAAIKRMSTSSLKGKAVVTGLLVLATAVPIINVSLNYNRLDLSSDDEAERYATELFDQIEDYALILAHDDPSIFSLWYQRYVREPDSKVTVIATPLLQYQWYWDNLLQHEPERIHQQAQESYTDRLMGFINHNLRMGPIYLTYPDKDLENKYQLIKKGKVYQVMELPKG